MIRDAEPWTFRSAAGSDEHKVLKLNCQFKAAILSVSRFYCPATRWLYPSQYLFRMQDRGFESSLGMEPLGPRRPDEGLNP